MKDLVELQNKYLDHALRIHKRAEDKPLTTAQQRGVNYYVCAAQAVEALMLR